MFLTMKDVYGAVKMQQTDRKKERRPGFSRGPLP
jgi:hypothetical protein